MGRYINCKVNNQLYEVYKYVLGSQSSEMYRISTELGIGEYHLIGYIHNENEDEDSSTIEYVDEQSEDVEGDVLILVRSDIDKLTAQITLLRAYLDDRKDEEKEFYIAMIESIRNFMDEHPELDKFTFIGEF